MEERVSRMIAKDGIDVPFANFITSIDMLKLFESEGYKLLAIRSTYKKTLLSIVGNPANVADTPAGLGFWCGIELPITYYNLLQH